MKLPSNLTNTTDLERRLAFAKLPDGAYRWPMLSRPCPCSLPDESSGWWCLPCMEQMMSEHTPPRNLGVNPSHGAWCNTCAGSNIVPNVTLETMMVALRAKYVDVSFSRAAGGWWVKARQLRPPYYESDHKAGDSYGVDATAALMASMGKWLDWLKGTSSVATREEVMS